MLQAIFVQDNFLHQTIRSNRTVENGNHTNLESVHLPDVILNSVNFITCRNQFLKLLCFCKTTQPVRNNLDEEFQYCSLGY